MKTNGDNPLHQFVRQMLTKNLRGGISVQTMRLRQIATVLPTILQHVCSSKHASAVVASQSFKHTNGFYKIVLHGLSPTGVKLRLHLWPNGYSLSEIEGDPHNHRWTYFSVPLFGTLYEERFRVTEAGGRPDMYEMACSPRSSERITVIGKRSCHLARYATYTRRPGVAYSCRAGIIHRLRPLDSTPTATLVLTLPPVSATAAVFRADALLSETTSVSAASLSVTELRALLSQIRTQLRKAHPPNGVRSSSN